MTVTPNPQWSLSVEDRNGQLALEIIVTSWLGEITRSDNPPEAIDDFLQWLVESGLYAALAGGKLEHEAAA